jgi:hypothetical protein
MDHGVRLDPVEDGLQPVLNARAPAFQILHAFHLRPVPGST